MGQTYKIDRLNLITYKGQKKKVVKSLRCRYMAKSQVVNCNAQSQSFEFGELLLMVVIFRTQNFKTVFSWQANLKNAILQEQNLFILLSSIPIFPIVLILMFLQV